MVSYRIKLRCPNVFDAVTKSTQNVQHNGSAGDTIKRRHRAKKAGEGRRTKAEFGDRIAVAQRVLDDADNGEVGACTWLLPNNNPQA